MADSSVRPTKKQREILSYIESFIAEHGYSPSYREIMNGLDYTSVATVSLHVNSLIRRGHLRKRDRSARSLEVVKQSSGSDEKSDETKDTTAAAAVAPANVPEVWLITQIDACFDRYRSAEKLEQHHYDELAALVTTLRVLGFEEPAAQFSAQIETIGKT